MADTSTLPVPVTEDTTKSDGKRGLEAEVEGEKIDSKNESSIQTKALYEDKVQNAVKFLSHPRVRGSPIVHRRSFLESKGLSKDEIEEAFFQVPDPPSNNFPGAVAATEAVTSTQQTTTQQLPPAVSLPVVQACSGPYWSHMALALGFLVAAGTGAGFVFKRFFLQKLKAWIRNVVLEHAVGATVLPKMKNQVDEAAMGAAVAARAASNAAAEITVASQEMIKMGTEERHYLGSVVQALEAHTRELTKAMMAMKVAIAIVDKSRQSLPAIAQANGKWGSPSPTEQRNSMEGIQTTQKVMAMREEVEKSLGLQEVNGQPFNPDQPPSVSRLQHRPKPWEMVRIENGNSLSQVKAYSSGVIAENTAKSALVINSWRQGDEASPMQQNYSSSSSDPGTGAALVAPWWRQRKAESGLYHGLSWSPESTIKSTKMEAITDNDGTVLESSSPSSILVSEGGGRNTDSSSGDVRHIGQVPLSIPQTVMHEAVSAIKYQMGGLKAEAISISSVLESPPVSLSFEVEDRLSPVSSHAVQNSPPAAPTIEFKNAAMALQLIQDHKGKDIGSVDDGINTDISNGHMRLKGWVPPSLPQTVMPEIVTSIKYQMGSLKDEAMSISGVLESPRVSLSVEVQDRLLPVSSHAVQNSPPAAPTIESQNAAMPLQLIQDHEGKDTGSEDGGVNTNSSNGHMRCIGWVPPSIPQTVMPEIGTAIKYQMEKLTDEAMSISSILESPRASLSIEVEDQLLPVRSHAVQNSPPAAPTIEFENAAMPLQLTQDHERDIGSEVGGINTDSSNGHMRRIGWVPLSIPQTVMPETATTIKYHMGNLKDEAMSISSMLESPPVSLSIEVEDRLFPVSSHAVQNSPPAAPTIGSENETMPLQLIQDHEGKDIGSEDSGVNTDSSNGHMKCIGWVPLSIPQTVMPEPVTSIKYQMGRLKDDAMSISSVLESPPVSLSNEVEDRLLPVSSHAMQNSPPAAPTIESKNVGTPLQLI